MVGPLAGAAAVALFGSPALFYYMSGVHALFLVFTIYRIGRRPIEPGRERADFVGLIRTSPAIFKLDPRGRKSKH